MIDKAMRYELEHPHVHVDTADSPGALAQVSQLFSQEGGFETVTRVVRRFASGPQRRDPEFEALYSVHTPGAPGEELSSEFSTTFLGGNSLVVPGEVIELLSTRLGDRLLRGAVCEVEQVVGIGDSHQGFEFLHPSTVARLMRGGDRYAEIHHGVNLPSELIDSRKITFDCIAQLLEETGIDFGGLFQLDTRMIESIPVVPFRTNAFLPLSKLKGHRDFVRRENDLVRRVVSEFIGEGVNVKTRFEALLRAHHF